LTVKCSEIPHCGKRQTVSINANTTQRAENNNEEKVDLNIYRQTFLMTTLFAESTFEF